MFNKKMKFQKMQKKQKNLISAIVGHALNCAVKAEITAWL